VKNTQTSKYNLKEEISAIEAARRLGIGLDYTYALLWTGKLLGRKIGSRWCIPVEAVEDRLKRRGE
jgi:excisionase family DNA binding protein